MPVHRAPAPLRALPPYALGVLAADRLTASGAIFPWAFLSIPLLLLIALLVPARFRPWPWLLLAGYVTFAMGRGLPADRALEAAALSEQPLVVRGVVELWEPRGDAGRARFHLTEVAEGEQFRATGADVSISWRSDTPFPAEGERLELALRLRPPTGPRNPGEFDSRTMMRRRGISFLASLAGEKAIRSRQAVPFLSAAKGIAALRGVIGESIDRRLDGFPRRFTRVLLLGDRVAFRPEEELAFRRAGVTHVLSVSGLHVGLVAATVQLLTGRRRTVASLLVSAGAIWLYTLLVGAPSAAVRSAAMLSLALVARLTRRRTSGAGLLSGAAFGLLVMAPALLFDLGFLLSVASIGGLLVAHRLVEAIPGQAAWPGFLRTGASVLGLTLGAQAATAPLTIPLWGDWPLVAPLANLLVVGLSDLILTGGFLALGMDLFDHAAATRVFAVLWGMCRLLGWLVEQLAGHSPGVTGLLPPAPWVTPLVFGGIAAALLLHAAGAARRWVIGAAAAALVGFLLLVSWPEDRPDALRVTLLDVGQGDATLVEFPDGMTLLVDGGEGGTRDTGARIVLPAVRAARHRRLDAVVLSHEHLDHFGGLFAVLASRRVARFYDSGLGPAEGPIDSLTDRAVKGRVPACFVAAGDTLLSPAEGSVVVLWPPRRDDPNDNGERPADQLNNLSVVLLVTWREHRLILPGDLEAPGEEAILESGVLPDRSIDFLKVGHHGSRTSTTTGWLEQLRPRFAGVPVGEHNKFRHPSRIVMARLRDGGARVHRTDLEGAWRLTFFDDRVELESWGNGRSRAGPELPPIHSSE